MSIAIPYSTQADNLVYTVVDDLAIVYWAVITGAVTDESLGDFFSPGFSVQVSRPDLGTKATERGLYAITGYPEISFPKLSSTSYPVDLVLTAPGFRDFALQVTIPVNATFPVPALNVAMRRAPVRIQGRVMKDVTPRIPISGALVKCIDDASLPTQHTIALRSPLYFPHLINAAIQEVTAQAFGTAQLQQAANAGIQVLQLSSRPDMAVHPKAFLRFSTTNDVLVEYGTVDHLGPGALNTPGELFLKNGLNRSYRPLAATKVEFCDPLAGAASGILKIAADAGDGLLIADQMLNVKTIVVDATSIATVEYHELGAITDGDGYYALNGIGHVKEIFLQVNSVVPAIPWFVQYDQSVNLVDFRI
jgi:hypothetical protein